jgi:uncharacterized damage-inducible protein DinB
VKQAPKSAQGVPSRAAVVRMLREVYGGPSWLGPDVRRLLRQVTARQAAWRPARGRNTIWDLTLHLALTRHIMLGRLTGERAAFPRPRRSTWWAQAPARPSETAWRADVALLGELQQRLVRVVERAPAARLARVRSGGRTIAHELLGAATHDAYHAGQIALLAKLAR